MQISNLFKAKSKCFKLKKEFVKKIFSNLTANFIVEANINKTSILEFIGYKGKCLLHFKDKQNCDLFRIIRDNSEKIIENIKNINLKNYKTIECNVEFSHIVNYIKQKTNKDNVFDSVLFKKVINKKTNDLNISNIKKLSSKISDYFITESSILDTVKAFNEKDNIFIIHFGNMEQTNFFKLHGSYMQFHKAKIFVIGDYLDNFKLNFRKYGFKPYMKNVLGNYIWAKNV